MEHGPDRPREGSELRDRVAAGIIDEVFVNAARRVARRLTRSRPGPTNSGGWSAEEIDDLIHDVVVRVRPARIVMKANGASNDAEFSQWLSAAIRSELNTRAGRTPIGLVIRAIDDALREEPERFVLAATGHWTLTDDDRPAEWGEGRAPLVALAWTIATTTVQISPGAAKTPPMAYRQDIRAVATAVLERAGPMSKVDLAGVLAERFNALFIARFDYLDLDADRDAALHPGTTQGTGSSVDDEAARWMLGQLTADERRAMAILAGPGGSIRQLVTELGCTKHKAELIHRRLVEKVRRLAALTHDDDGGATARLLEILGHHDDLRRSLDQDEPRDVA